jgi:hypothetical protein
MKQIKKKKKNNSAISLIKIVQLPQWPFVLIFLP